MGNKVVSTHPTIYHPTPTAPFTPAAEGDGYVSVFCIGAQNSF